MAITVSINMVDVARLGNLIAAAGEKAPDAIRRAVNHTGDKTRTQLIRALTAQTGLKRKVIVKAVKVTRANYTSPSYVMTTRGGNISLKHFGARETRNGVSAAPWNRRQIYAGTFMRAGWFPNRVVKGNWHGHVFKRTGGKTASGMDQFEKQRSGLFIPQEMVTGATESAFMSTVQASLPARLEHELYRLLPT